MYNMLLRGINGGCYRSFRFVKPSFMADDYKYSQDAHYFERQINTNLKDALAGFTVTRLFSHTKFRLCCLLQLPLILSPFFFSSNSKR